MTRTPPAPSRDDAEPREVMGASGEEPEDLALAEPSEDSESEDELGGEDDVGDDGMGLEATEYGEDDGTSAGPARGGRRCFFWNECRAYAESGHDGATWAYCGLCYAQRRRPCPTPQCPRTCSLQAEGGQFHPFCGQCRRNRSH